MCSQQKHIHFKNYNDAFTFLLFPFSFHLSRYVMFFYRMRIMFQIKARSRKVAKTKLIFCLIFLLALNF